MFFIKHVRWACFESIDLLGNCFNCIARRVIVALDSFKGIGFCSWATEIAGFVCNLVAQLLVSVWFMSLYMFRRKYI